ncbi:MAG: response regulator transcription factor [Chloroflexota bacterium]|jgi:DNA-binding NarL/FixJ family response regulator
MRVILADDQPKVRFALRVLLESKPEIFVISEATDAQELVGQIESGKPDMVILDWQLPGLSDIGFISALRKDQEDLFILVLSGRPELGRAALEAGADNFLSKIDPPDGLLATVRELQEQLTGKQKEIGPPPS